VTGPTATLILDFDGTLTQLDIGDALCDLFAPPAWRHIDERWLRGELALDEAQTLMWGLVRASEPQFLRAARELGELRAGCDALLARARAAGYAIVLASGGFDLYIRAILGPRLEDFHAVYCNSLSFVGERAVVAFPHKTTLGCARCAVCKGKVVRAFAARGPVVFVGDGSSDACALGVAQQVYAVRGRTLERLAQSTGQPATPFESLHEVVL
jgi:2,3-diketo-5-methylthio-1-phosphopentane phosphatase